MRSKAKKATVDAVALHWFTFYTHVHGAHPSQATSVLDHRALRELIVVQCHSDEDRALALVEQIVRAPIDGERFERRYAEFWNWHEKDCPKHKVRASERVIRGVRARIAWIVERRVA